MSYRPMTDEEAKAAAEFVPDETLPCFEGPHCEACTHCFRESEEWEHYCDHGGI